MITFTIFLIGLLGLALINDAVIPAILLGVAILIVLIIEAANHVFRDLDELEK